MPRDLLVLGVVGNPVSQEAAHFFCRHITVGIQVGSPLTVQGFDKQVGKGAVIGHGLARITGGQELSHGF